MTRPIIAVSGYPTMLPLCKALAADYDLLSIDSNFTHQLRGLELPARSLADFAGAGWGPAANDAVKMIEAVYHFQQSANSLDPQPVEWVRKNLAGALYGGLLDLATMVYAYDAAKPSLVIVHNDVEPATRLAALWAKARGVPCLHVPHSPAYQDVNRGAPGTDIHDMITASNLAAAGPYQAEWYKTRGMPDAAIEITGSPQFDKWAAVELDQRLARQRLGLPLTRPVVVYASTWPQATNALGAHDEWAFSYLNFLQGVKGMPVEVVVKLHPNGGQANHQWHYQQAQEAGVTPYLTHLYNNEILTAADLVICYGASNLLLEAAHIPWVRLATIHGYAQDDEIYKMPDLAPRHFSQAIKSLLAEQPPDYGELIAKYLGWRRGGATERVIEYARGLVKVKSPG